jgi:hypothetical protein
MIHPTQQVLGSALKNRESIIDAERRYRYEFRDAGGAAGTT